MCDELVIHARLRKIAKPAEVVRLDAVTVTISADRFNAIRAEERSQSILARTFGKKANEV